jgi:hypothetical protein
VLPCARGDEGELHESEQTASARIRVGILLRTAGVETACALEM